MADRKIVLTTSSILLVTFLIFLPSLWNGFLYWDDNIVLYQNQLIMSLDWMHIQRMFTSTVQNIYCPLTFLSFAWEHHWAGFNPWVYHLDNVLLHVGVTGLVIAFGLRLGMHLRAAAIAALIFGLHPIHVESVAWATERKDVLYSFFYLLSLCFFLDYLFKGQKRAYGMSLFCCLLSVLSKPMALSLPLVLCLLDWFTHRPCRKRIFLEKIPFFLCVAAVAALSYQGNARWPLINLSESPLVWVWTFTFYLLKFLWPHPLLAVYSLPHPIDWLNPPYMIAGGCFVLFVLSFYFLRHQRWWCWAGAFYIASIFFILRLDDNPFDTTFVADRFMYLPSLGFCLFLGFSIDQLFHLPKKSIHYLTTIAGTALIAVMAVLTSRQIQTWRTDLSLWNHVLKYAPEPMAYANLGNYYRDHGQEDLAIKNYFKSLEAEKFSYKNQVFNSLARIAQNRQKFELALNFYAHSLAINPYWSFTYLQRGFLYYQLGKFDLALKDYDKAIEYNHSNPNFADVYYYRALALNEGHHWKEALDDLTLGLHLTPLNMPMLSLRNEIIKQQLDKSLGK